jgi:hypothetical protein
MRKHLRLTSTAWHRLLSKADAHGIDLPFKSKLSYKISSITSSALLYLQNASYADALQAANPLPPIFLLGFWRSGTTLLHELFCVNPRFGYPSTYTCMNPTHFLLSESFMPGDTKRRTVLRPMDEMKYSWASPQEDEFALLSLGAPSPYEALLLPSLMLDPPSLLDLHTSSPNEVAQWKNSLLLFLRLLTVQQNKPIILKSPPHGFRLHLLSSMFPEARYVVIERNPYEVFASNLKLWRTLTDTYGMTSASMESIEAFVLAAYVLHEETIAKGSRCVPAGCLAKVRYEDLVAEPVKQIARLYAELGLDEFESVRPKVETHALRVAGHVRNHFLLTDSQKARVEGAWGQLIHAKNYKWDERFVKLMNDS